MRIAIVLLLAGCNAAPSEPEAKRPLNTATPSAVWFKGEVYCPPGTVYEGTVCKPLVVLDCPAGTKFKDGVGCVPLEPSVTPSSTVAPPFTRRPPPGTPSTCECPPNDLACVMRCSQRPPKFEPPPPAIPQSDDPFGGRR